MITSLHLLMDLPLLLENILPLLSIERRSSDTLLGSSLDLILDLLPDLLLNLLLDILVFPH